MTDVKLPPTYEALVAENRYLLREYDRLAREKHKLIDLTALLVVSLGAAAASVDNPDRLAEIATLLARVRETTAQMHDEPGFLAEMLELEKQHEPA